MAKILICVPCMDMVASGFAQSLAMLQKGGNETDQDAGRLYYVV